MSLLTLACSCLVASWTKIQLTQDMPRLPSQTLVKPTTTSTTSMTLVWVSQLLFAKPLQSPHFYVPCLLGKVFMDSSLFLRPPPISLSESHCSTCVPACSRALSDWIWWNTQEPEDRREIWVLVVRYRKICKIYQDVVIRSEWTSPGQKCLWKG